MSRILLFDIDGTLTQSRKVMEPYVKEFLYSTKLPLAVVGGSDFVKAKEQLGIEFINSIDYCFSENGLVAFNHGKLIEKYSIKDYLGEEKLNKLLNFCLYYLSTIDIPIKRGTFIEYRNAMINISPIGRNCSQEERDAYEILDKKLGIRQKFIDEIMKKFSDYNIKCSIGGQISFDLFPIGWDKTYCVKYLKDYKEIHFFGDKTMPGGNDYELFIDKRVIGHSVKNPDDTIAQIKALMA